MAMEPATTSTWLNPAELSLTDWVHEDLSWALELDHLLSDIAETPSTDATTEATILPSTEETSSHQIPHGTSAFATPSRTLQVQAIPRPDSIFQYDSDESWSADDILEEWQVNLQRQLSTLRATEQVSITTSPLRTSQRRQVHAMAQLMHLSHISLGSGREKRMLISKCSISGGEALSRARGTHATWHAGTIDPKVIVVSPVSPLGTIDTIERIITTNRLIYPEKLDLHSHYCQSGQLQRRVHAKFSAAEDAAAFSLALSSEGLTCQYLFNSPQTLAKEQCQHCSTSTSTSTSGPSLSLEISQTAEPFWRNSSYSSSSDARSKPSSFFSMDTALSDNTSLMPSDLEYGSDVSVSKKRKRLPKTNGGYVCGVCGKAFDYEGDRAKHEKVHNVATRPHVCEKCGKGFMYPKDLRRHCGKMHSSLGPSGGSVYSLDKVLE